jgi:hypothetical protein
MIVQRDDGRWEPPDRAHPDTPPAASASLAEFPTIDPRDHGPGGAPEVVRDPRDAPLSGTEDNDDGEPS